MKTTALEHLVCPQTNGRLRIEVSQREGDEALTGMLVAGNHTYELAQGIPSFVPAEVGDEQTVRSFSQKWEAHTYYREHTARFYTEWYLQRYDLGDLEGLREFLAPCRFVLDAGTGSGRDAQTFADNSNAIIYAVDTALEALRLARQQISNDRFSAVHADINHLPFPDEFFDFINCDQVIHHTAKPRETFVNLKRKLKPGGQICCYVYRKKAAIREFSDDHVREQLADLPIDRALELCQGITRLGKALSEISVDIEIEEDIEVLGIRKGKLPLQRFVHWNVMKCFWNDEFDFFTNNIINFDWYHPRYCHRFEPDEFRDWFSEGWTVQAWDEQEAGMSCRAKKD